MTKDTSITLRLDATERARLDALAAHYEIGISAVVRSLAKREVERLGLMPRSGAKKKGAR